MQKSALFSALFSLFPVLLIVRSPYEYRPLIAIGGAVQLKWRRASAKRRAVTPASPSRTSFAGRHGHDPRASRPCLRAFWPVNCAVDRARTTRCTGEFSLQIFFARRPACLHVGVATPSRASTTALRDISRFRFRAARLFRITTRETPYMHTRM